MTVCIHNQPVLPGQALLPLRPIVQLIALATHPYKPPDNPHCKVICKYPKLAPYWQRTDCSVPAVLPNLLFSKV